MTVTAKIRLKKVKDDAEADVDIVAIHGIDDHENHTNTWSFIPIDGGRAENWRSEQLTLPESFGKANLWLCDWYMDLTLPHELKSKSLEDIARDLMAAIDSTRDHPPVRPILFIASSFGGVILMKALVLWSHESSLQLVFSGAVLIGTPLGSTSFARMVQGAKTSLKPWATKSYTSFHSLLKLFEATVSEIDKVVGDFTNAITTGWRPSAIECQVVVLNDLLNWGSGGYENEPPYNVDCAVLGSAKAKILKNGHAALDDISGSEDVLDSMVRRTIEQLLWNIRNQSADLSSADEEVIRLYQSRLLFKRLSFDKRPWPVQLFSLRLREVQPKNNDSLSGEALEHQAEVNMHERSSSMGTHLVELQSLFDDQRNILGKPFQPRRIFIQGQPGIGKSTLCKRAVYEHVKKDLWKTHFDRILWICLRNLGKDSDLFSLFHSEFFPEGLNSQQHATALVNECAENGAKRTLFILDGLDEVCYGLPHDGLKRKLLLQLLNMPNVIVTSRRSVAIMLEAEPFHVRVEAMGFDIDQINAYIDIMRVKEANAFKARIKSEPVLQELCRVPIQLDALCFGWSQIQEHHNLTATAIYMAIFPKTEDIPRNDLEEDMRNAIIWLGTTSFQALVDDNLLFHLLVPHDLRLAMLNIPFVQALSHRNHGASHRLSHPIFQSLFAADHFCRMWKQENKKNEAKRILQKHKYAISFDMVWRFVVGILAGERLDNEFLTEINCAPLDLLGPVHQRLLMNLLQEVPRDSQRLKVLERQLIEWLLDREVVQPMILDKLSTHALCGLVKSKLDGLPLDGKRQRYFPIIRKNALEALCKRPGDITIALGDIAALLCNEDQGVRTAAGGVLGSINLTGFLRDPNNSKTFYQYLSRGSLGVRQATLDALKATEDISESLSNLVIECIKTGSNANRAIVLGILRGWSTFPERITTAIIHCVDNGAPDVRLAAVFAVRSMLEQPRIESDSRACGAVARRLVDSSSGVRCAAVYTFRNMHSLPQSVLAVIEEHLKHGNLGIRMAALDCVRGQDKLPEGVVEIVADCLGDKNDLFRTAVVEVLRRQTTLPIERIAKSLSRNSEPRTRMEMGIAWLKTKRISKEQASSLDILKGRSDLPQHVMKDIGKRLADEDLNLRWSAVFALKRQHDEPVLIKAVIEYVRHKDANIARAVADVLMGRPALCKEAVDSILQHHEQQHQKHYQQPHSWHVDGLNESQYIDVLNELKYIPHLPYNTIDQVITAGNKSAQVRRAAIECLRGQSVISESALLKVIASGWLDQGDCAVRCAAVNLLGGMPALSSSVITEVVNSTINNNQPDRNVTIRALYAMANQQDLPEERLDDIVKFLDDEDNNMKGAVFCLFKSQQSLSNSACARLVKMLANPEKKYVIAALHCLKGRHCLDRGELEAVTKCLDHEDMSVRRAAADALQDQPQHFMTSPEEVTKWLKENKEEHKKRAAIYALEGKVDSEWQTSEMLDATLDAVADCIGSNDAFLAEAASSLLRGRAKLPESTIRKVTDWIKSPKHTIFHRRTKVLRCSMAALEILRDRDGLSKGTSAYDKVAMCMDDEDINLRWSAVYALKGRMELPESTLKLIARCLDDNQKPDIKWGALEVLKGNSKLPVRHIGMVAGCLRHKDKHLRKAAFEIVMSQTILGHDAVKALLRFKEPDIKSTLQLIGHKEIRDLLLTGQQKSTFKELSQTYRERRPQLPVGVPGKLVFGGTLLVNPPLFLVFAGLIAHEEIRIRMTPAEDLLHMVLEARSEPFLEALFQAAQRYHIAWVVDTKKCVMEVE